MRRILKKFENFSQPAESVEKPDQPVHQVLFFGTTVRVLGVVCISSQPFGVEIVLRLFFWILESLMKNLKIFENFSQPVGKPDQSVH